MATVSGRKAIPALGRKRLLPTVVVLALAASGAGIAVAFSSVRVCDDQPIQGGAKVRVCRHLQVNDPPIIAAGFGMLLLAGFLFQEVSGFGFTLKRTVEQVTQSAAEAKSAAQDARGASESARSQADLSRATADAARQPSTMDLDALAQEYKSIRLTQGSGPARTRAMTDVVSKMIVGLRSAEAVEAEQWLESDQREKRLLGYAYGYTHPEKIDPLLIARAVLKFADQNLTDSDARAFGDRPFGTYWGLRSLNELIQVGRVLDRNTTRELKELLRRLPAGTDRSYELGRLLGELDD
ncbi:MAG: hypothetical protein ACKVT1_05500 [Dehalococcoidia bacterium]